jgi:hypothetical protein
MNNGVNPLRWDCNRNGCFNVKCHPKVEIFADCFPGLINFSDLDFWVEKNGFFLLMEWKGKGGAIRAGQDISFKAFSRIPGNVVYVVDGDPETMKVWSYTLYEKGNRNEKISADLASLKTRLKAWMAWAEKNKSQPHELESRESMEAAIENRIAMAVWEKLAIIEKNRLKEAKSTRRRR